MYFPIFIVLIAHHLFVEANAYAVCGNDPYFNDECIRLTECDVIMNKIRELEKKSMIEHDEFLVKDVNNRTCGFEGSDPLICCPINNNNENIKNLPNNQDQSQAHECGKILGPKSSTSDGSPTEISEFPWLALLEYQTSTGMRFGCGGVLISDRYILTAAQCLKSTIPPTNVHLGEYDLRPKKDCDEDREYCKDTSVIVGIEEFIPHEDYNSYSGENNIALLRLAEPVSFNDFIQPICLSNGKVSRNKLFTAGWGRTLENLSLGYKVKTIQRAFVVEKNSCVKFHQKILDDKELCVETKSKKGSCVTDVGGPLMAITEESRITVEGIFAAPGNRQCQHNRYTDVRKYVEWINNHTSTTA